MLWELLIQFIFRLTLGLALAMLFTSPRSVDSGFFRVHLWVLLGLGTFGSLVAYSRQALFDQPTIVTSLAVTVTLLSYIGSVIWLYEKQTAGRGILATIVLLAFVLLLFAHPSKDVNDISEWWWLSADIITGSSLLGVTFASMLLGHWYLNSPTMKLDPLRGLLVLLAMSILMRALLCAAGFAVHYRGGDLRTGFQWAGLAMRWLAGILGLAGMTWMTWETLKIPNTQSATGILYVALVFAFLGELASSMLTYATVVPL